MGLTEEMDLVTLTSRKEQEEEEDPVAKTAREKEGRLKSLLRETMGRVHFGNTQEDLACQSQSDMQHNTHALVVVETATTSANVFAHMLADEEAIVCATAVVAVAVAVRRCCSCSCCRCNKQLLLL